LTPFLIGTLFFLLGGCIQGSLGFGLAMIVVPPLLMVLPATTVVPTLAVLSLTNTTLVLWHLRSKVQREIAVPLVVGAIIGLPGGIYLLTTLDGPLFKAGVGVLMIALSFVLLSGWSMPLQNPKWALYPIGIVGGFLGGSISISGPPVILFLTSQGVPKENFRANIATYFTFGSIFGIAGFAIAGILTREVLVYSASVVPALLVGTFVGMKLSNRIPQSLFRRLTLVCVIGMGLILTIRNVVELLG